MIIVQRFLSHVKHRVGAGVSQKPSVATVKPDYDYIDLGALARNMFYMLLRESITQG